MAESYTIDELEQAIYELAVKFNELKALEVAIDQWNPLLAVASAVSSGPHFVMFYNEALEDQGAVMSSGDYPDLESIPDRCRNIVSLDPEQFRQAQQLFDAAALDMADLEGAPGNALNKIGNWYGEAAEAFEEYFTGYIPAQARQAELFAAVINACASMESIATQSKVAVSSLVKNANTLAEEMIKTYWDTQKAMQDSITIAVVSVVAAGLSAGAASGALAITGALGGGGASLASAMYSFHLSEKQLSAKNMQDLLEAIHQTLVETESAMTEADDEIYRNIESLRSEWNMREIAIPAPPGSDEVDTESFHHESSL